jgi:hypothetical protein
MTDPCGERNRSAAGLTDKQEISRAMTCLKVCARIAGALATLFTALAALAGAASHLISQIF